MLIRSVSIQTSIAPDNFELIRKHGGGVGEEDEGERERGCIQKIQMRILPCIK